MIFGTGRDGEFNGGACASSDDNGIDSVNDDVAEIFSPPRVVIVAKRMGMKGEWSFDKLVERSPGVPWDLTRREHQRACMDIID